MTSFSHCTSFTSIFFSRPTYSILGNVLGTDLYLDTDAYQTVRVHHCLYRIFTVMFHNISLQAREIPGIKIFRSSATIYYANAEMYLEALQEKVCVIPKCIPFALSKMILIAFVSSLLFHLSSLFLMTPDFLHRVASILGIC